MNPNQPIGLFDSGIGGLTVAKELKSKIPGERLIYFGDTAHLPYGDKSVESIKYYSLRIAQYLLDKHCKMIVIACSTASAVAYNTVKDFVGKRAIVVNVIEPVIKKIAGKKNWNKIGVIGTKGTIKSGIHAAHLTSIFPNIKVGGLATPLLVPMIEEGFFNNNISRSIIHSYLSHSKLKKIDALILGCTHFPLIIPEIIEYYKGKVTLYDPSAEAAEHIELLLRKKNLLNNGRTASRHQFFVSDYTEAFEKSTIYFFGKSIHLKQVNLWN